MAAHKVIMDVDPGIDDSLAILFASLAPEIELLGLTVVAGNVSCSKGRRNALHALHAAGDWQTPIFRAGAEQPLQRRHIAAEETHGCDGFGELHDSPAYLSLQQKFCAAYGKPLEAFDQDNGSSSQLQEKSAVDFILETLERFPGQINLLALGPLTNLALAWLRAPDTMAKAKQIIIMGGTARHPGNCSPVAEYNFWVDPHAAQLLLTSELPKQVPIVMVGLDATHQIVFSPNLRKIVQLFSLNSPAPQPLAQFIYELTRFYTEFHWLQEKTIGCVINDPLIPAFLLHPQLLVLQPAYVDICTTGLAIGQSLVDFDGTWHAGQCPIQVAIQANVPHFFYEFLRTLFPAHQEWIEILLQKEFGWEHQRQN